MVLPTHRRKGILVTYELIMLLAFVIFCAHSVNVQRIERAERAEAMRRHPAGKGR